MTRDEVRAEVARQMAEYDICEADALENIADAESIPYLELVDLYEGRQ